MKNRILKWTFLLVAVSQMSLYAKLGMNFTIWALVDGNAFRNYEAIQDQVVQPNLTFYYNQPFKDFTFQIYYTGSGTAFKMYPQRRFLFQTTGLKGSYSSQAKLLSFYWGGEADFRTNELAYDYYEYNQKSAYLNMRADWMESAATFGGLSANLRKYALLPQFDFNEVSGFIRQNIYLPTRTTLIGSITIGRKRFMETVESDATIDGIVEITDPEDTRGGNGRGNGQNGNGKGNEQGQTVSTIPDPVAEVQSVYVSMQGKSVTRMLSSIRIAQSVTATTGLAVEASRNRSLSGQGRYLSYQDGGYEENDLLFDDPYNYDSDGVSLELTQILPFSIQLKAGWQGQDKRYYYPAFDMEGNSIDEENRSDQKQSIWIQLSRAFPAIFKLQSSRVLFSYTGYRNQSNDPFYTYSGYITMLGWQIQI